MWCLKNRDINYGNMNRDSIYGNVSRDGNYGNMSSITKLYTDKTFQVVLATFQIQVVI